MKNIHKAIFALISTLVVMVLLDRAIVNYKSKIPVASPGECLKVFNVSTNQNFKVYIVNNDLTKGESEVMVETDLFGLKLLVPGNVKFKDLRILKAQKVGCDEKIN